MASKHVIIAIYPGTDKADQAANLLKDWDKANDDIKLGGVGILTWEDGKIRTRKVGGRATGKGAKWGVALGAIAGILSGGVTLLGGALAGAVGGAALGSLFHKNLGLTDEDWYELERRLKTGEAALVAMADPEDVDPTKAELASLGGTVQNFTIPDETMAQVEQAEEVAPAEKPAGEG